MTRLQAAGKIGRLPPAAFEASGGGQAAKDSDSSKTAGGSGLRPKALIEAS